MRGLKWRSDVTITELFAERVRSTPAATALRFRGEDMTYQRLALLADHALAVETISIHEKDKPCD